MSAFGRYHPAVNLFYFLAVLGIGMFVNNPIIQCLSLLGGICFSVVIGRKRGYLFCFVMFLLVALTNPLFSHNGVTPIFFLNGNAITKEAILCGIGIGIMIVSVIIWFGCFNTVMNGDKILYIFGKIIPKAALIISVAMRFIPLFIRRSKSILKAQKALGISDDGIFDRIKNRLKVFTAVTSWAFENAIDTAASMKARAYKSGKRTSFNLYKFCMRDGFMLGVIALLFFICIFGVINGWVNFDNYPAVSGIDITPCSLCAYCAYGILAFLPFIIEAKEILVWKYCVSKI